MKTLTFFLFLPSILFAQGKKVTRIIDGDTFETSTGETVRITGIDAPGINSFFGANAKNHLQQLIGGKLVILQGGGIFINKDHQPIDLKYVYLNNTDIGQQMILDGYAVAWLKHLFVKSGDYRQAKILAQSLGFGMWHNPAYISRIDTSEYSSPVKKTPAGWFDFFIKSSPKEIFVGFVILVLLLFGIYVYLKK